MTWKKYVFLYLHPLEQFFGYKTFLWNFFLRLCALLCPRLLSNPKADPSKEKSFAGFEMFQIFVFCCEKNLVMACAAWRSRHRIRL
jgi:hypothetical protein